jgi:hypothetical protein
MWTKLDGEDFVMSILLHLPHDTEHKALNTDSIRLTLASVDSDKLSASVPPAEMTTRRARCTRIFQIGFNKCGTNSIYRFLQRSGIFATRYNRGQLATTIRDNISAGLKPLAGQFDGFSAFTDINHLTRDEVVEGGQYFRTFHAYYPTSYFVLNTRDKEGWLRDRQKQGGGTYARRYASALDLHDESDVVQRWSQDWDRHHQAVIDYFADKPGRLLVHDINSGNPQAMVDFLAPDFITRAHDFRCEPEDDDLTEPS